MIRLILSLLVSLYCFQHANATQSTISEIYLGSREADPASIVENVSTIYGDYTEVEIDLIVASPDPLVLSRFYSSRDNLQIASFGGWRFNPHCYLTVQKDPKGKTYTSAEGKFERTYAYVGTPDGSILTYIGWKNVTNPTKRVLFKIDAERETVGMANTAKGNISYWTNLKNNELYFDPQTDSFELFLCSEGKRFYTKHTSGDFYFITHEILPSGNKIFYEFDEKGKLFLIKETNAAENKILAWIQIQYANGIHINASDGKTVDYQFELDSSGVYLLTSVFRSDKPDLHYQYQVVNDHAYLFRKTLPEGRFVEVDYYKDNANKHKVRAVTTPIDSNETTSTQFSYKDGSTEVDGPGSCKAVYRFDEDLQLIAIEQYLGGSLYRVHKKSWGRRSDAGNLISTSIEDGVGNVFYHRYFIYDSKGNIAEEREYGDVTGTGPIPLVIDDELVTNQDGHTKSCSYFSGKTTYGFFQRDAKGTGVKYWYKKGTNLLLKKFILTKGSLDSENENYESGIKQRHFYTYDEDATLIRVVIDDGKGGDSKDTYAVSERKITNISPKQELPNVGAPEVVEEKYSFSNGKSEFLLKKIFNQFDDQGNIHSQAIYDANEEYRYSVTKRHIGGLLVFETDPIGNETHYTYDANRNLVSESHSDTGISIEYGYDLRNRIIYTIEKDQTGNQFKTQISYDQSGYKVAEVDRFGNETIYVNDDLGRPINITYPEVSNGSHSSITPKYTYTYDIFDNPISVTDPKGRVLSRSYTVKGKPAEIHHLDGTKEVFRYDSGGNLHHYYGRDGIVQEFEYNSIGRLNRLHYFKRGSKGSGDSFKRSVYDYNAFHKISETDEVGNKAIYTYDGAGRLASSKKDNQLVEFSYDSLGRTHAIKKWKSSNNFTLEVKEYDLLDRVIEERTEDSGRVLIKKRYAYNDAGQLTQIIGYPQNKESVLMQYEYDGFGRLCKTTNAVNHTTQIFYDEMYVTEWGQKGRKCILVDPIGNQTEEIYDNVDNLIKITKKDKSGQSLSCLEISYDSSGNKVFERAVVTAAGASQKELETEWSFNQRDQLESITLGKGTTEERITRFAYNSYGDLAAKYNPGSQEPIAYLYDHYRNLEKVSYKEGKKEIVYKLAYDHHRNLTGMSQDTSFSLSYTFDVNSLPLVETIKDEFGSYQVSRTYDGEGNIQTLQFPDGSFVTYSYEGPFVKTVSRFSKDKKELYTH